MFAIDKTRKLVSGLRDELRENVLPLNGQTPEKIMNQTKNFETSHKDMAQEFNRNESMELGEPPYMFESNDYPTIATTQSHRFVYSGQLFCTTGLLSM